MDVRAQKTYTLVLDMEEYAAIMDSLIQNARKLSATDDSGEYWAFVDSMAKDLQANR